MPKPSEFVELAVESLRTFGPVTTRRMFGGWGIYRDGVFFALIAHDTLYFKSDEESRAEFERASPGPFTFEKKGERRLSPEAARSAVFIMLYRDEPIFQMPFSLLQVLLDIDESMATWRYRHMNMVNRMIGLRVGTGGSTGKAYLRGALDSHYIFQEIADLSSFLIDRKHLPELPHSVKQALSFRV